MGVVQIHKDTSSHKLHFMPLLHLFWQFYSVREVPCVLADSCHYFRHSKKPKDRDKQVYICLSFCCASESEGGFLLTGSGWYRPCQNWLEAASAGPAEAWLCMAPDCCRPATALTHLPRPSSIFVLLLLSPVCSALHTSVIWATLLLFIKAVLCAWPVCLFKISQYFKGILPSPALPISRSPPCQLMLTTLAFTPHSPPSIHIY